VRTNPVRVQQREAAALCVQTCYDLVGNRDLTFRAQQRQRSGRAKADTWDLGAEFVPQFAGAQRDRQLVSGSARHPDQPEIAHRGPAGFRFALQLDDLVAAADRLEGVRGAEDAAADDRHPHAGSPFDSPRPGLNDECCRVEQ
jgi:hypothetical protein